MSYCDAYLCDGSGFKLSDLLYKNLAVVTVTEHLVFHTKVHFQQLKTVSKGAAICEILLALHSFEVKVAVNITEILFFVHPGSKLKRQTPL